MGASIPSVGPSLKSITGLFVRKAWSQCNRLLRINHKRSGESSPVLWTIARFLCGVQQRLAQREAENDDQPNVKISRIPRNWFYSVEICPGNKSQEKHTIRERRVQARIAVAVIPL
jgi:hypothetical protein